MKSYLTLHSPLDSTVKRSRKFDLYHISGEEELCGDFTYKAKISSFEKLLEADIEKLIGEPLTVKIAFLDQKSKPGCRYINGIVYELKEVGMSKAPLRPEIWRYEIEISSWAKQLEFVQDCRIFQKAGINSMSIVTDLLKEMGFTDFKNKTTGKFTRRDYTVIYNETVSNFMRRLLQEDGIIWYFEHSEKKHVLVFKNDSTDLPEIPDLAWGQDDAVKSFCRESVHIPVGSCLISSYDWENLPVKNVDKPVKNKKSPLKHFQYPGGFIKRAEGVNKADRRKIALNCKKTRFYGESTMRIFTVGYRFNLFAPTLDDLHEKPYLLKKINIDATSKFYTNTFVALPSKEHYLPLEEKSIQKPVIFGSQTAVVVGEAGTGKIQTDKLGRVKVRFHWDHHSPADATHTSAFIRVAGPCAGSQRGFLFTPRVGEEVMVSYEDGDPEKPLITGSVYSNEKRPPKTPNSRPFASIIKTGEESDANCITFNETPDKETLDLQAKKDLNFNIGGNLNIDVEDNIKINVKKVNIIVRKNVKIKVGGNIVSLTLDSMKNTAGSDINTMALGGVVSVAGGAISNMAGKTITNTAIWSVENTSAAAINSNADTLMANTAVNAVASIGPTIKNNAKLAMTNISQGGIMNAAPDVKSETMFQKVKIKEASITETGSFKIKGMMSKIN